MYTASSFNVTRVKYAKLWSSCLLGRISCQLPKIQDSHTLRSINTSTRSLQRWPHTMLHDDARYTSESIMLFSTSTGLVLSAASSQIWPSISQSLITPYVARNKLIVGVKLLKTLHRKERTLWIVQNLKGLCKSSSGY